MSEARELAEFEDSIQEARWLKRISNELAEVLVEKCGWEWGFRGKGPFKTSHPTNAVWVPECDGITKCFYVSDLLTFVGMSEVWKVLKEKGLWVEFSDLVFGKLTGPTLIYAGLNDLPGQIKTAIKVLKGE